MVKHRVSRCFTISFYLRPFLIVVFLSVDSPAGPVLTMLEPGSFPASDCAVGLRPVLQAPGPCLLSLESSRLTPVQLSRLYTLSDSPLLPVFPAVHARRPLRESAHSEAKNNRNQYQNANKSLHFLLLRINGVIVKCCPPNIRQAGRMAKSGVEISALPFAGVMGCDPDHRVSGGRLRGFRDSVRDRAGHVHVA